jgi:hypothetical protein
MGVYPGSGTPCFGAGINLLNFLPMRAGLTMSFRSLLSMSRRTRNTAVLEPARSVDSLARNPKINVGEFADLSVR